MREMCRWLGDEKAGDAHCVAGTPTALPTAQSRGFNGFSYADVASELDHEGQPPATTSLAKRRAGEALIGALPRPELAQALRAI